MRDIAIENLTKSYGEKRVLSGFSTVFAAGETVLLSGPSGCGKTTLLRLISGRETADSGKITGVPERIACVFQEDRLLPGFSVRKNLRLVTGVKNSGEAQAILEALGIGDTLDKSVNELSGGMQRRVAIARALLFPADLVLMDEPFKGLDSETKKAVLRTVRTRLRGKTFLLVSHDETEAAALSARILRMKASEP